MARASRFNGTTQAGELACASATSSLIQLANTMLCDRTTLRRDVGMSCRTDVETLVRVDAARCTPSGTEALNLGSAVSTTLTRLHNPMERDKLCTQFSCVAAPIVGKMSCTKYAACFEIQSPAT